MRSVIPDVNTLPMKDLMTKVYALMDSHFTTFKPSINASTPVEVDNYSISTEIDLNAVLAVLFCQGHSPRHDIVSLSANICLVALNRSEIPTHGYETLTLSFGSIKHIWKFLVAEVTLPILGADFLSHFHLLVNVAHWRLINVDSYSSTSLQPALNQECLRSLPHVIPGSFSSTNSLNAHGSRETLYLSSYRDDGAPVFARLRHLPPNHLAPAKQMFPEMKEMGLCQIASSPWSSPLHIVLK
ncbi:uncharacterized protein [Palaemon carinicauda]|uniref:uncharacterized protein n=1 Tax=Palaemon carinicauda TaxID=392227 RepID=UPI0035B671AA